MTTPVGPDDIAASTHDLCGDVISQRVRELLPSSAKLLDVGAGWGKYRWLLPEYEMDAIEVWSPYIEQSSLHDYYRTVWITDAYMFHQYSEYNGVIFGDVLEHISVDAAQQLVRYITRVSRVWVGVPFMFPQGAEEGNPYEEHQQEDLNFEVMSTRYPELHLVVSEQTGHGYVKAVYEGGIT
jgi:hypothetical protein